MIYEILHVFFTSENKLLDDDSQESAKKIMKFLIKSRGCEFKIGVTPKFKGFSIGATPSCYFNAIRNKGDVLVFQGDTTLLYIEVHSGISSERFVHTTKKTILCLFSFLKLMAAESHSYMHLPFHIMKLNTALLK